LAWVAEQQLSWKRKSAWCPPSQADEDLLVVAYPQHRLQAIIWDDMENLFSKKGLINENGENF